MRSLLILISLTFVALTAQATNLSGDIYSKADPMAAHFYVHSFEALQSQFPKHFTVSLPDVDGNLPLMYACTMRHGKNISPAIQWQGIPKGTVRLRLILEDASCTIGCDTRGKFDHWVLDFPVSAMQNQGPLNNNGLAKNAGNNAVLKPYTLSNGLGLKQYIGPCTPSGQHHAFVIKLIAYHLSPSHHIIINGKTMSTPFNF